MYELRLPSHNISLHAVENWPNRDYGWRMVQVGAEIYLSGGKWNPKSFFKLIQDDAGVFRIMTRASMVQKRVYHSICLEEDKSEQALK